MKDDLERDCDDITLKIDEIMRTELITFDKLKDITSISLDDWWLFYTNNLELKLQYLIILIN